MSKKNVVKETVAVPVKLIKARAENLLNSYYENVLIHNSYIDIVLPNLKETFGEDSKIYVNTWEQAGAYLPDADRLKKESDFLFELVKDKAENDVINIEIKDFPRLAVAKKSNFK